MRKKFLTNLGLLMFLNLLVKPFWVLGVDRSVQNAVGAEQYGFYFSILNFSFLFNILLDMGITNFNNRNIAQNNHLLNKHFSGIIILRFILAGVYAIITFGVGILIGYDKSQLILLSWVVLNQFLLSFILYLRSNISGLLLFKTDSLLSILDRLLMILFISILLWGNVTELKFKIEWFVYAQTVAYGLTALTALAIVMHKASFKSLNWNFPFLVMIIKKSLPYALLILLMMIYNRVDTVLIERLLPGDLGSQQAGVYAQAYRLLDATNMIAFLFAVLLLPIFAKMLKMKESVEKMVKLSFSLLFTISVIVAFSSYFYSTDIMSWLYPKNDMEAVGDYTLRIHQSAKAFSLLMFAFIAISTSYVFGTLLTANGSLKQLNMIAGAGVIVSLTINYLLIPNMQSVGSAYASLSAQFLTVGAQVVAARMIFKFKPDNKFLSVLVIFVVGVLLAGYFSRYFPFDWKVNLLIMIAVSGVLAIVLRLLHLRDFVRIIRDEKS